MSCKRNRFSLIRNELSKYIDVWDVPVKPNILSDPIPPCANTVQDFYVQGVPGNEYLWETQNDWIIQGDSNGDTVSIAVGEAQQYGRKVMVEKHITGETFKVIVANGEVIGVVPAGDGGDVYVVASFPNTLHFNRTMNQHINYRFYIIIFYISSTK